MFPIDYLTDENMPKSTTEHFGYKTLSPSFNLETGEFDLVDGKIQTITGEESVRQWIRKVINTEKGQYEIYDIHGDYGIPVKKILYSGNNYAVITARIKSALNNAIQYNNDIFSIMDLKFTRKKRSVLISFTLCTKYGEVKGTEEF